MPTKTISLEVDAYQLLKREKQGRESFSQAVRRLVSERPSLTAGELLDALKPFEGSAPAAVARVVVLLLDTSFLVALEGEVASRALGAASRILAAQPLEPVAVSIVSLAEFAEGFEEPAAVEAFLSRFRVLTLSRSIAYKTAAMQRSLPRRLGENDAWIAATALAYDAVLVGRERAYTRVPRLRYLPF